MGSVVELSGKDEKPIITIPACPTCGGVPRFWILDGFERGDTYVGWLLSDQYIKDKRGTSHNHVLIRKHSGVLNFDDLLKKIEFVRCGKNWKHRFSKDTSIFCDIKTSLEYYNAREGFQEY